MAYTTLQLLSASLYLGGVVARSFETPSGEQTNDALQNLNEILADQTIDEGMIPYFTNYTFNGVVGQQKYFIPDLIDIDTFVFYLNTVRYATQPMNRVRYFGTPRAENINSLPFQWHMERTLNGANIFMYFFPDQNYPMEIWGQFRLSSVAINQDLTLTLDQFYIDYLKYALADRMCQFYQLDTPNRVAEQLQEYILKIKRKSGPIDLYLQKQSNLQRSAGINYGDINIGHGYRPGP